MMMIMMIKFWPPCAPGNGICGGAKIFATALLQPERSVCVASERFFLYRCFRHSIMIIVVVGVNVRAAESERSEQVLVHPQTARRGYISGTRAGGYSRTHTGKGSTGSGYQTTVRARPICHHAVYYWTVDATVNRERERPVNPLRNGCNETFGLECKKGKKLAHLI